MKKRFLAIFLLVATLGLTLSVGTTTANAKRHHYTTVPTSLRGHWYHYNSRRHKYDQVKATKYHFYTKSATSFHWYKVSGKKFPRYAYGHSELGVKKYHGNYIVGKYATDGGPLWKKVTRHHHASLRASRPATMEDEGAPTKYYFKTKALAKRF